jgi:hypothetical protein
MRVRYGAMKAHSSSLTSLGCGFLVSIPSVYQVWFPSL